MNIQKAYVFCTGCPESRIDSARVKKFLKKNGCQITNNVKNADLIVYRACGLTKWHSDEAIQIMRRIKKEKKNNTQFIVWGCLPKIDPEALRSEYDGITFGENELSILNEILNAKKPIEDIVANDLISESKPDHPGTQGILIKLGKKVEKRLSIAQNESIFHIKVSTGCLGACSFCAVRISRGLIKSKNISDILNEFRSGLKRGFKYYSLLATDLGAYGRDLGSNLSTLLSEMLKEEGDYRIGLRNINPHFLIKMFEELKPILLSGKIWFLSSAAESGSNAILKEMNRKYLIEDFIKCIQWINKNCPNILLRTQLMVGFPKETTKDFSRSLNLLDKIKFDWVEVYKYSKRKGTLAATIIDQIPEKIKEKRFRQLTLKAIVQKPHKKIKFLLKSYFMDHCERQEWHPLIKKDSLQQKKIK